MVVGVIAFSILFIALYGFICVYQWSSLVILN
jgi:hypothetical protein